MSTSKPLHRVRRLVIEFAVIVVGVMTALAGDAWLENRSGSARAEALLPLLREDLAADSLEASRIVQAFPTHDSVYATFWATPVDAVLSADSAWVLLREVLRTSPFRGTRSAFDALTDTDGLRYIDEGALAPELLRYYQRQGELAHWSARALEQYDVLSRLIGAYVTPSPTSVAEGMRWWTEVPMSVTAPWSRVRSDEELMTGLWYRSAYEEVAAQSAEALLELNRELMLTINALM